MKTTACICQVGPEIQEVMWRTWLFGRPKASSCGQQRLINLHRINPQGCAGWYEYLLFVHIFLSRHNFVIGNLLESQIISAQKILPDTALCFSVYQLVCPCTRPGRASSRQKSRVVTSYRCCGRCRGVGTTRCNSWMERCPRTGRRLSFSCIKNNMVCDFTTKYLFCDIKYSYCRSTNSNLWYQNYFVVS